MKHTHTHSKKKQYKTGSKGAKVLFSNVLQIPATWQVPHSTCKMLQACCSNNEGFKLEHFRISVQLKGCKYHETCRLRFQNGVTTLWKRFQLKHVANIYIYVYINANDIMQSRYFSSQMLQTRCKREIKGPKCCKYNPIAGVISKMLQTPIWNMIYIYIMRFEFQNAGSKQK